MSKIDPALAGREIELPAGPLGLVFQAGSTKIKEVKRDSAVKAACDAGDRCIAFRPPGGEERVDCRDMTDTEFVKLLTAHKDTPGRVMYVMKPGDSMTDTSSDTMSAASPGPVQMAAIDISVVVPPDAQPNQMMQVQTPTGQQIAVKLPPGTAPGSVIQVHYAPPALTVPAAMEPITIEADKELSTAMCSKGKRTFDVMASAAYMPAQLRAYVTPEEYESAFAMSNKLHEEYIDIESNVQVSCACSGLLFLLSMTVGIIFLGKWAAVPLLIVPFMWLGICAYKLTLQPTGDRIGEPFKQWENNGQLKVSYTFPQIGGKGTPYIPPAVRVHFPTS